jgi:hypothetical protein
MSTAEPTIQHVKELLDKLSLKDKKELMIDMIPTKDIISNLYVIYGNDQDYYGYIDHWDITRKVVKAKNMYEASLKLSKDKSVRETFSDECCSWAKEMVEFNLDDKIHELFLNMRVKDTCFDVGPTYDELKEMCMSLRQRLSNVTEEDILGRLTDNDWYLYIATEIDTLDSYVDIVE